MVVGDIVSEVDVLVIGGGLAGYTAAIRAAQLGKEVTLIERGKLGGVCLNEGCIPSKALLTASQRFYQIKEAEHMGVRVRGGMELDFPAMQKWKNSIITQLQQGVAKLLKENHVTVVKGEAFFSAENEVRVTSEYRSEGFRFNHCIIATGSSVKRPESFPRHSSLITYAEALHLQEVPERFLVLGGGYIGIELATAYRKLGSEVIIVSTEDRLLPDFDVSLARMVARRLKKLGIEICLQARDLQLMEDGDRIKACARINEEVKEWRCDKVMFDEERLPNTDQLGLDFANVKTDGEGFILVDEQQRTSNPNIYAAGDVVGKPMLAHKGCYEGKIAAEAIAGKTTGNDATVIPRIIYGDPEVVSVGWTQDQAKRMGYEVAVGRFPFGASGRALTLDEKEGFVQIVADQRTKTVLGIHMVGTNVSELAASAVYAIEMRMTVEDIALSVHAHPTLSEGLLEAAESALGIAIHVVNK